MDQENPPGSGDQIIDPILQPIRIGQCSASCPHFGPLRARTDRPRGLSRPRARKNEDLPPKASDLIFFASQR